jgi:hypothetical protein
MRRLALALALFLLSCGGSGPSAKGAESEGANGKASAEEVQRVRVGTCDEKVVAEGVKSVSSSGAGWAYVVPSDTQVQCSEFKAVLAVGSGLNIVITSYVPGGEESGPAIMTEMMVRKATEDVLKVDPDAKFADVAAGKYGEKQHPGHCGRVTFAAQGQSLRSVVCSVSATAPGNVEHILLVAITDTEEGFRNAGSSDVELFSQLVNNWAPTPAK